MSTTVVTAIGVIFFISVNENGTVFIVQYHIYDSTTNINFFNDLESAMKYIRSLTIF
jgi:hypothetical protein